MVNTRIRPHTFPAPLGLPGDELDYNPDSPQQTVAEWFSADYRNRVTEKRKTIYVVPPPTCSADAAFATSWTNPETKQSLQAPLPNVSDIAQYLQAFYYGLPVKTLETQQLEFQLWSAPQQIRRSKRAPALKRSQKYVGLSTGKEVIRIRARPSPDKIFSGQLNLNDLLDTAISIVPEDAYALLMLVHHDLYEDDEDDFCCGRAYGGSRVAVVSTARYRPELDVNLGYLDLSHTWPASHCSQYVSRFFGPKGGPPMMRDAMEYDSRAPIDAAVMAHSALPIPSSPSEMGTLWLGRVCKTASHELGHCFGIDHCSYFACVMQGTANLVEDSRQPPYLCPIDLTKVLLATGVSEKEHYDAMLKVCERRKQDRMFAAFGAWINARTDGDHVAPADRWEEMVEPTWIRD